MEMLELDGKDLSISNMQFMRPLILCGVLLGLLFSNSLICTSNGYAINTYGYTSGFDPHGPYVDQLHFVVYPSEDIGKALRALLAGTVDGYDGQIWAADVMELNSTAGVEVKSELGCLFRQVTINCQKFPTNITGYRRAISYAIDKYAIKEARTGGFAQPMDGVIPIPNSAWTYEDQIFPHFYYQDIAAANESLEEAGFRDLDGDGWREYDVNGNDIWDEGLDLDDADCDIEVMASAGYCSPPRQRSNKCGEIYAAIYIAAAMAECGMRIEVVEADFNAMISALEEGTFSLGIFTWTTFPPGEPFYLYEYFHSQSSTNLFFCRYNCSEYDYNVTRMMTASAYQEARGWAWNCSQLLIRDMPVITLYNDIEIHGYRNDIWDGYVNMVGVNRMGNNPWTLRKLHLKAEAGGPFGIYYPVVYRCVLSEGLWTTNVIMTDDMYTDEVMRCIYDRLWQIDPFTWEKVPGLAYNWTLETTVASGDIQDGMKYTFHLFENVTWHDGTNFTSADVAYSLGTIWPFAPYHSDLVDSIYRIDTPDEHTVLIYSNQTGYLEFAHATWPYILPKHIWEPHYNFTSWVPSTAAELVGTGPFIWNTRVPGEFILLDRNPTYHFGVDVPQRPLAPNYPLLVFAIILTVAIIVVLIQIGILGYLLHRRKRDTKKV